MLRRFAALPQPRQRQRRSAAPPLRPRRHADDYLKALTSGCLMISLLPDARMRRPACIDEMLRPIFRGTHVRQILDDDMPLR